MLEPHHNDSPRTTEDGVEGVVAVVARWLQIAAVVWLTALWPKYGPLLPWVLGDILYWFSWLVMAVGGLVLIAIAYRRPDFRRTLLISVALLWLFLGVGLSY